MPVDAAGLRRWQRASPIARSRGRALGWAGESREQRACSTAHCGRRTGGWNSLGKQQTEERLGATEAALEPQLPRVEMLVRRSALQLRAVLQLPCDRFAELGRG